MLRTVEKLKENNVSCKNYFNVSSRLSNFGL